VSISDPELKFSAVVVTSKKVDPSFSRLKLYSFRTRRDIETPISAINQIKLTVTDLHSELLA